jgi:hypothetical protein
VTEAEREPPWLVIPVSRYWTADNVARNIRRQSQVCYPIVVEVGHARGQVQKRWAGAEYITCASASPAQARNLGVERAKRLNPARAIVFLDDDDWYAADYVADQMRALREHPEAGWVCKPQMLVCHGETLYAIDPCRPEGWTATAAGGTIAVRRADRCLKFPERQRRGEDVAWAEAMTAAGHAGWAGSGLRYVYRIHADNSSGTSLLELVDGATEDALLLGDWDPAFADGTREIQGERVGPDAERRAACLSAWSEAEARAGRGPFFGRSLTR